MFVISFIGNTATLIQMRRLRRRKSTINTLIVNLALADLLVSFFCIAGESVWAATVQWLAGNFMCKLFKYMQVFALYLSTYITVAISLDRCVAILDPMRRNGAAQRVRVMISFAWIFSALFSIPQSIVFSALRGPFKEDFYQCVTFGSYDSAWQPQMYAIASLMLMFVLPLAVIGTAYGLIFTTISRKSKEHSVMDSIQMPATKSWVTRWVNYKYYFCMAMSRTPMSRRASIMTTCSSEPSRGPVRSHLLRKAKRKSLRMSFVIVLASILCWTPYYIIFIFTTFLNTVIDPQIFNCFAIFGLSNSLLNPIIYGAFQLCKVQFYTPSSWRRNAWRVTSPKQQSSNPSHNPRSDFPADTPASSSMSRDSRNRLLANNCQCDVCHYEAKEQKVHLPLFDRKRSHAESGRCWNFTHKHFADGHVKDCLCFHSY
ncbi:unnamed protein product [Lymnaea stagnalis]|uniref:G-protein coupled receptors family 1 profile domain-containing protein n=1 Tax=Lymnaea stagnalis TaxID=6523 RepID=A0AAV2H1S6_LYMST